MKRRLRRKDLKRNDLAQTVGRTVDYVSHHRRGVTETIAVAAGLAVLVAGLLLWRVYRENQAGKELSAALAALDVPLVGQPAASGAAKTYATSAERERDAREHLRRAASRRGTAAGRAADVVLAARGEAAADAPEVLAKAAREGRAVVAAAAEIDVARLLAARGKTTEAVERLRRAIESPQSAAPKDALLFALAEIYENSGSAADARATYQRLLNEHPESPYRADARQKIPTSS
ncbi:MAG: tetratricopeptide repeat protein [Thermoanaerobaculia bacterium]